LDHDRLFNGENAIVTVPDVVDVASRLIGLDSQSHVSNVAVADYVVGLVGQAATRVERIEYADRAGLQKISIVAQFGEGRGGLALSSHMDTVPGLGWSSDPFQATAEGDRLYGLGACDMKGPLAATLVAALAYLGRGYTKPLTLLLSADEETDTEGALRIARESKILADVRPQYCVIAEPTDLRVANAHKAAVTFSATTTGRAAHSSTGQGVNANIRMIPFANDMWSLYKELTENEDYFDAHFEPPYPDWNIVIDNFDTAPNVTVPKSHVTVNFRYTPQLDPAPIIRRVEESARINGVDLDYWSSGDPLFTPADSPLVRLALELAGEREPVNVPYRTDACIFASAFPCVVYGAGSHEQAHTVDEWVSVAQLHRSVKFYEDAISRVCS
jgi:acetylornithine deacetylase